MVVDVAWHVGCHLGWWLLVAVLGISALGLCNVLGVGRLMRLGGRRVAGSLAMEVVANWVHVAAGRLVDCLVGALLSSYVALRLVYI